MRLGSYKASTDLATRLRETENGKRQVAAFHKSMKFLFQLVSL